MKVWAFRAAWMLAYPVIVFGAACFVAWGIPDPEAWAGGELDRFWALIFFVIGGGWWMLIGQAAEGWMK